MHYEHNIVEKSIAYIFWVDEYEGDALGSWKNAKQRAETAQKFYKEVLEFDEVKVFEGKSEEEVHQKFEELQEESDMFEFTTQKQGGEGVIVISVVWIGQVLYFDEYNFHEDYRKYIGGDISDDTEIGNYFW